MTNQYGFVLLTESQKEEESLFVTQWEPGRPVQCLTVVKKTQLAWNEWLLKSPIYQYFSVVCTNVFPSIDMRKAIAENKWSAVGLLLLFENVRPLLKYSTSLATCKLKEKEKLQSVSPTSNTTERSHRMRKSASVPEVTCGRKDIAYCKQQRQETLSWKKRVKW